MKFLITIKATISKDKKPTVIPATYFITEAFNQAQVDRRMLVIQAKTKLPTSGFTIEPLDKWLEAIPTL